MNKFISGIHHVTAITGDAQSDIDFYTKLLGLRLVKRTVNFENSEVSHLYFGDEMGNPGTILTTFPYGSDLPKGRHGRGMVNTTAFSVDLNGLDFWIQRLEKAGIAYKHPQQRMEGEVFVYLEDGDGLGLELVFNESDSRQGFETQDIPREWAFKGIHHVELWLDSLERTTAILTQLLDLHIVSESSQRIRLGAADKTTEFVDLIAIPEIAQGRSGRGTVHHIALATNNLQNQRTLKNKLESLGINVSEVKDRKYFSSIYFREPGGVLFEIATSGPGFSVDEDPVSLGESLMLPPQFEGQREKLKQILPELSI